MSQILQQEQVMVEWGEQWWDAIIEKSKAILTLVLIQVGMNGLMIQGSTMNKTRLYV